MPQTKEERAIYNREYREKNKEKMKQQDRQRYLLNKEKRKQERELNKEHVKEYNKAYRQTESGIKSCRIGSWKYQGMILRDGDDWDSIHRM